MADLQVNLRPKEERSAQSHAIAVRVRPRLAAIAAKYGAAVAVAEVPPGPRLFKSTGMAWEDAVVAGATLAADGPP